MKRSIQLRNVCACAIFGALELLAEAALKRQGPNHPCCPDLAVLKVEEHMVPLSIHLPACHAAYGIFAERPALYNPWGKRVLGVSVRLCDACPDRESRDPDWAGAPGGDQCKDQFRDQFRDQGPGVCRDGCRGCANACCPELTVYITQLPEFPLPPDDVDWFLYHYFNMPDLAAASIPQAYRYLYDVACQLQAESAAPLACPDAADGTSQPAHRRKPGAPPLDCNAWLYRTMRAMPDPRACGHLRPHWQELYLRQMGVAPENWEKSFRAAARYCLRRILRARGEPDSLAADDQAGDDQEWLQGEPYGDEFDSENGGGDRAENQAGAVPA